MSDMKDGAVIFECAAGVIGVTQIQIFCLIKTSEIISSKFRESHKMGNLNKLVCLKKTVE